MSTVAEEHLHTHSVPRDERWVALYVMCVGMLMVVLDVIVVNAALPSIRDNLDRRRDHRDRDRPQRVVRHATSQ
jgi:hypothetical protein